MNKARFLCDECIPSGLVQALHQLESTVDLLQVGDQGAPPKGTKDPDLLLASETMGRVLVSRDRNTMPPHLVNHFAAGHHTGGVILLRNGFTIGQCAQAILDEWANTTADQWVDRTIYLP